MIKRVLFPGQLSTASTCSLPSSEIKCDVPLLPQAIRENLGSPAFAFAFMAGQGTSRRVVQTVIKLFLVSIVLGLGARVEATDCVVETCNSGGHAAVNGLVSNSHQYPGAQESPVPP